MQMPTEPENNTLDGAIGDLLNELKTMTGDDPAYAKTADQLEKLYGIKKSMTPDPLKLDTLVTVGGNVVIALLVIGYEQKNVMTTRVFQFLGKAR